MVFCWISFVLYWTDQVVYYSLSAFHFPCYLAERNAQEPRSSEQKKTGNNGYIIMLVAELGNQYLTETIPPRQTATLISGTSSSEGGWL